MRIAVKETPVYHFTELSEKAKEVARIWYLDDPNRTNIFSDDCQNWYDLNFPNSSLKPSYELRYCQGDGYNTKGELRMSDVIDKLDFSEKEKRTLHFYFDNLWNTYTFQTNRNYGYSCKFIDKKFIEDTVEECVEEMVEQYHWKNINKSLIEDFYEKTFDYFENMDKEFEKSGYKYFYEADDDEIAEVCEENNWEFTENGDFYY